MRIGWAWPGRRRTLLLDGTRAVAAALVVARAHGWRVSGVHRVDGQLQVVLERRRRATRRRS